MIAQLVDRGDLDELIRMVDRLCLDHDWDGLVELRDSCRAALERGRQLWPAAAHAEYRIALEAPGRWAGRMLEPGAGRFTLGPLTEVAASTHRWDELAAHVPPGPLAGLAAHERVVRGEDLRGRGGVDTAVLELPLVLQSWEPAYPLAEYGPDRADFPSPGLPSLQRVELPRRHRPADDHEACDALVQLAAAWTTESNGRAEAVSVSGDGPAAVAALGLRSARMAETPAALALSHMAWAGASGGAHGRRRGMASGRFAAWWALAALRGLLDRWPSHPDELGDAAQSLRWWAWDAGEPWTGWRLQLAVEDPARGRAWAVAATDAVS